MPQPMRLSPFMPPVPTAIDIVLIAPILLIRRSVKTVVHVVLKVSTNR